MKSENHQFLVFWKKMIFFPIQFQPNLKTHVWVCLSIRMEGDLDMAKDLYQRYVSDTVQMSDPSSTSIHPVFLYTGKGSFQYDAGCYTGDMVDGLPDGTGIVEYKDNKRYEGGFHQGVRIGMGVFTRYQFSVKGVFRDHECDIVEVRYTLPLRFNTEKGSVCHYDMVVNESTQSILFEGHPVFQEFHGTWTYSSTKYHRLHPSNEINTLDGRLLCHDGMVVEGVIHLHANHRQSVQCRGYITCPETHRQRKGTFTYYRVKDIRTCRY